MKVYRGSDSSIMRSLRTRQVTTIPWPRRWRKKDGSGDFAEFWIGKEEHRGKETEKQAADLKRSSSADTLCDCPKRGKLGGVG